MPSDRTIIKAIAERQFGVVSAAQAIAAGASASWLSRQVDRELWQRLAPGVYLPRSGPVPWKTRAAAGLLYASGSEELRLGLPLALSHDSAAYLWEFTTAPPGQVHVLIPEARRVRPQPGLVIARRRRMPPAAGRLRKTDAAETVLDLAAAAEGEDAVVAVVAAAARARVWPAYLRQALAGRGRVRHRSMLLEILAEVEDGVESALEHRYRGVERRHGLPRAVLQVRERLGHGLIRSDVRYEEYCLTVELDGGFAHPFGRTDADTWRDNAVLLARGDLTLRYRWAHAVGRPCEVAVQVGGVLRMRGWTGVLRRCGPGCAVGRG